MRAAALLLLAAALAGAQDMLMRGADLYNKTCATGYCHGPAGAAGSAPRLAARGFSEDYIAQTLRRGIPGTAMPSFGTTLPRGELAVIVAYVASLNGIAPSPSQAPQQLAERKLPPEAERGRALFFDAVRGFGRCATCHEVDAKGIPVASPIAKIPASAAELKSLATPQVRTATIVGASFPALVISQGSKQVKLYDLTSPPPVLRTLGTVAVTVKEGSSWRHASALAAYSDTELEAVLVFLRAAVHH